VKDKEFKGLTLVQGRLLDARQELTKRVWGEEPKLYNHAVLCSVGLPYRDQKEERSFQRISGATSLRMEAGALPDGSGGFEEVGLPFGPRARLLLLHLCSLAVKTNSPIVEVEDSFTGFARSLGLSTTGRNLRTLREQVRRMSVVSMRLSRDYGEFVDVFQGPIFSKLRATYSDDPDQRELWPSFVEFSPEFYESLKNHAVPLRVEAIGALKHSSRALDIYAWLASRLWRVKRPTTLKWTTMRFQFGNPTIGMGGFKRAFLTALKQVLLVYPEADVSIGKRGITIRRSPPPVRFAKSGPKPKLFFDTARSCAKNSSGGGKSS